MIQNLFSKGTKFVLFIGSDHCSHHMLQVYSYKLIVILTPWKEMSVKRCLMMDICALHKMQKKDNFLSN